MIPRSAFNVEKPVYEIDERVYRRFPVHKQSFVTLGQKDTGQTGTMFWVGKMLAQAGSNILSNTKGKSRLDYALDFGGNALNMILGTYGMPNSQFLKWNPLFIPELLSENPIEMEPDRLTELAKFASRVYGSDLVGVAGLDQRWVYSEDISCKSFAFEDLFREDTSLNLKIKPIVFEEVTEPTETDDKFIIPNSVDKSIVMAVAMNIDFITTSPAVLASTAAEIGYSRMGILAISMAEFIRSLGYVAIPCMNDTALSIPLAIDAGLGQIGRNGLLITPEYGPCVRLCKVLTNMPLIPDKPIDYGITDFCKQCLLCASKCPSGSISFDKQSFEPVCENNNPGVNKWYLEPENCLQFWQQNGTACSNCISVCPFTSGFVAEQCVECESCDNPNGCSLQTVTFERDKYGYSQRTTWGSKPVSCPLVRVGL